MCPGPPSGVAPPVWRGSAARRWELPGLGPTREGECARGGRRAAGPGEPRVRAAPLSPGPGRKRAGLQRGLPASAPARRRARLPPASSDACRDASRDAGPAGAQRAASGLGR